MAIPKIIHQIWFQGKTSIPKHLQEYEITWKQNNPNFEHLFWDEKSINQLIDEINVDWIKETYNSFPLMIQKIDFAKYIILYYIGGVYVDMDMKSIKPLDTLLELPSMKDKKVILSNLTYDFSQRIIFLMSGHINVKNLVNNGVIICEPKHEILFKTMEYGYKNKSNFFKNKSNFLYIFYSTGPLALSNSLIDYTKNNQDKIKEIELLDQTYFEGCDLGQVQNKTCQLPPNAIGLHYYESSWTSNNERKMLKAYYFMKNNFIYILLAIFLIYYFTK